MEGWIKLHRKLSDNPFWTCEPFTRGQAWVDLLLIANYDDNFFYVRGIKIDIKRGQVGWSEPRLSERWKWSRTKLRKFLNDLEKEQQIIQHKDNVTQVITIINYDEYQKKEQQKDSSETAEGQQKDPNKNDKNEKKDKEINKIMFEEFRKIYPSSKRGLETEYATFQKHKDWKECLSLLKPAIENQIKEHDLKVSLRQFVPEWKNLQTWLNKRWWEVETTHKVISITTPVHNELYHANGMLRNPNWVE